MPKTLSFIRKYRYWSISIIIKIHFFFLFLSSSVILHVLKSLGNTVVWRFKLITCVIDSGINGAENFKIYSKGSNSSILVASFLSRLSNSLNTSLRVNEYCRSITTSEMLKDELFIYDKFIIYRDGVFKSYQYISSLF